MHGKIFFQQLSAPLSYLLPAFQACLAGFAPDI
jgi:hypothetical protein